MKRILPLIAMLFVGAANAQTLPLPDVPAVQAFVNAITHNFYESRLPLPFYSGTLYLAERDYLNGIQAPNGAHKAALDGLLDRDIGDLLAFNLYWTTDPHPSLSDPAGSYGNYDSPWVAATEIITATNDYDNSVAAAHDGGHGLEGTGNLSLVRAPEIDSSSAISGLTLLFGGLLVLRGARTARWQH